MTPERFSRLVEAYGSSSVRWPRELREDAKALMRREPEDVGAVLREAGDLDFELSLHVVAPPSIDLVQRIVASASTVPTRTRSAWHRVRCWLPGIGIVGVGASGVAAGLVAMSLIVPSGATVAPVEDVGSGPASDVATGFETSDAATVFGSGLDEGSE